jgi:predicted HAD superfamily Cof-like phosphohydrolase
MSNIFNDQKKFMKACGQSIDVYNQQQFDLYVSLIDEEYNELKTAISEQDRVEQLDALIDILVVTAGALHSLGVNPDGAWKEVMRSNFDKVDKRTGLVRKREDGKVLKPQGWEPPKLTPYVTKE